MWLYIVRCDSQMLSPRPTFVATVTGQGDMGRDQVDGDLLVHERELRLVGHGRKDKTGDAKTISKSLGECKPCKATYQSAR
ncbi:hypothetical protein B0H12DRAFT_1103782 [Mycena haematopus]|nr:hypothetical protein B0H12DRAFT_1103782 [Mycena haematopus]